MLQCWEIDLDERPEFEQLAYVLADLAHQGNVSLNHLSKPSENAIIWHQICKI
jgi:hypothetical protein